MTTDGLADALFFAEKALAIGQVALRRPATCRNGPRCKRGATGQVAYDVAAGCELPLVLVRKQTNCAARATRCHVAVALAQRSDVARRDRWRCGCRSLCSAWARLRTSARKPGCSRARACAQMHAHAHMRAGAVVPL